MFKNAISYLVTPGFRLDPEMLTWKEGKAECTARLSTPLCALPPTEKMKAARRFHHKTPNLIEVVRHSTDRAALEDALRVPDLQKSVADAIKRRLRNLGFVEMPS